MIDDGSSPLPREIAPGVFWLGRCLQRPFRGEMLHQYASVFLVVGDTCSAVVEAGFTQDAELLEQQLDELIRNGVPEPQYLFVTHPETPHAGGIGRFLERFPDAQLCGGVSDLHLVFPQHVDRIRPLDPGDRLDLGDVELVVVEPVFRDLAYTRWLFDPRRRVLFVGDGFSFSHYHRQGHCGRLAEEVVDLNVADEVARFALAAFNWTQYVDVEPYITRLNELIFDELDAVLVAPTHGLPIGDPAAIMPEIERGLRQGSRERVKGSLLE